MDQIIVYSLNNGDMDSIEYIYFLKDHKHEKLFYFSFLMNETIIELQLRYHRYSSTDIARKEDCHLDAQDALRS